MFWHFLIIPYLHKCMYLWEDKTTAFCAYGASLPWIICPMSPSFMLPLAAWRRERTSSQQLSLTQPLRNRAQTTSKNGGSCSWKFHCNQLCMIIFQCLFLSHMFSSLLFIFIQLEKLIKQRLKFDQSPVIIPWLKKMLKITKSVCNLELYCMI